MNLRPAVSAFVAAAVVTLSLTACGAHEGPAGSDVTWVGTITTEGNVTTVVNESGSVWGGDAELVEEASIGVELGDDAYMLGYVSSVLVTDDRIFVGDRQVPVVRVYDLEGRYLRDLGAQGQGPGEYTQPGFMVAAPGGRILVMAPAAGRINVYGPGDDDVDTWPLGSNMTCCVHPMQLDRDGVLWVEAMLSEEATGRRRRGVLPHDASGPIGEPVLVPDYDYERLTFSAGGRELGPVPLSPAVIWNVYSQGGIVAGASDRYRFEILRPDGRRTIVEKSWEPVTLTSAEGDHWRRVMDDQVRRLGASSGQDITWDGRLPATKPAFSRIQVAASGEIWVARENPAVTVPDCEPAEAYDPSLSYAFHPNGYQPGGACFIISSTIDVFGDDGRFLGSVHTQQLHPYSFIRDDTWVTPVESPDGTIMVKRYRLVVPGETEPR
jgi:hypothetical protein